MTVLFVWVMIIGLMSLGVLFRRSLGVRLYNNGEDICSS
jgi:hypothetical protein